jgi:hypothetical protein
MEAYQKEEGIVGQPRLVRRGKSGYRTVDLTENEKAGAVVVRDSGEPRSLFIGTKRPANFPVGAALRLRNAYGMYGWTVKRHDPLEFGRIQVVLHLPERIYNRSGAGTTPVRI